MALLHSAFCIFQSLLGLASRKTGSHNGTDWLKLAIAVAAQPEEEDSRSVVRTALQSNNQEFLDYLRSALDTRSSAAARVAQINGDGIEGRAFLPGSPALWGWTTNMTAEAAVLQAGIEAAMQSSIFDSPAASCSNDNQDVFVDINSSEAMGGATLRDIYAKAWELHREPLIWTPRGPGAGVGASTWTLTPVSLTLPSAQTRTRRASDASDARSSIVGLSPCLYAQRNQVRRDSLHDVFVNTHAKQKVLVSPFVGTGVAVPSPPLNAALLPPPDLELPASRHRRSESCTRSHASSTTAMTVSECSTTQELHGFGLGLSLGGSTCSRPSTPSEIYFGENKVGKEMVSKGRKQSYHLLGGRGRAPNGMVRHNEVSGTIMDNSKQFKLRRPGITPLQRVQSSLSRRANPVYGSARAASASRAFSNGSLRGSHIDRIVPGAQPKAISNSRDKFASLRRAQSAAVMALSSSSARVPRIMAPKVPLLGPVPAAKQIANKRCFDNSPPMVMRSGNELGRQMVSSHRSVVQTRRLASMPTTLQKTSNATPITPSMTQSRIPRPVSRAASATACTKEASVRAASPSPKPKPRQLLTPTSTVRVRERTSFSRFTRSTISGSVGRTRSQTAGSMQERPTITRDRGLSRPSSRTYIADGSDPVIVRRLGRPSSAVSTPTMVDRWETMQESFDTPVFA